MLTKLTEKKMYNSNESIVLSKVENKFTEKCFQKCFQKCYQKCYQNLSEKIVQPVIHNIFAKRTYNYSQIDNCRSSKNIGNQKDYYIKKPTIFSVSSFL